MLVFHVMPTGRSKLVKAPVSVPPIGDDQALVRTRAGKVERQRALIVDRKASDGLGGCAEGERAAAHIHRA